MASMKKLGDKTEYGKVAGILWIGERYYMLLKDGVVSLMPASNIEARPTVRAKRPVQQAKAKITPTKCANYDQRLCNDETWCPDCSNYKPA